MTLEASTGLLADTIDMHVHPSPSLFPRSHNDLELAQAAADTGMRGFVIKDHDSGTAARAEIANTLYPELEIFGGLVMNRSAGGIDPHVVEANLHYGAKIIWFPTTHSYSHCDHFGGTNYSQQVRPESVLDLSPIDVVDSDRRLTSEVQSVVELVAHYDACIATGHLSYEEIEPLLSAARHAGIEKFIVTHANWAAWKRDLDVQRRLIDAGAYLEYVSMPCVAPGWIEQEPTELAQWIFELGPERLVLSSDLGQKASPAPPAGFERFLQTLVEEGVNTDDIARMTRHNPAGLLSI